MTSVAAPVPLELPRGRTSDENGTTSQDSCDSPAAGPKATRRGTATTAGSSSPSPPYNHEKTSRRVSFTATTKMDPPAVVEADHPDASASAITNDALEYGTTTHAYAAASPSPNKRRSSLEYLNQQPPVLPYDSYYSQSFPQPRFLSPNRPSSRRSSMASRRSSLDSCSSYGSGISSCFSGTDLASVLSQKDEAFQRAKLLTCLEWTSRHVSRHLVQQLMQQVQQEKLEGPSLVPVKARRRGSTSSIRKTSARQQPRRHSQPASFTTAGEETMVCKAPRRSSCSFVHCDTQSVSDDKSEHRHQQRMLKTQESMDRLSVCSVGGLDDDDDDDQMLALGYESHNSLCSWAAATDQLLSTTILPPSRPHQSALLMVDISGFTKLSTTLPLQALSQTINAYFQSLIECIQDYGGDVVRFAGDAVMAEWRLHDASSPQATRAAVKVASACACQIIQRCSDYHVYQNNNNNNSNNNNKEQLLATLNVHCGVGFGTVIAFHAGDETRREYMLLGDPIPQAADAIALGRGGEVVASPQAYQILVGKKEQDKPQVIFSSRHDRFETTPNLLDPSMLLIPPSEIETTKTKKLATILEDWDLQSLNKLQTLMSLYVHASVVNGELFTTIYHNHPGAAAAACSFDSGSEPSSEDEHETERRKTAHDQRVHQAEAEIRKVFTLFVQPLLDVKITGDPEKDDALMSSLNEIMVLANRELARFKGHLRQYIVDDKGVVLIANFGLRGSMCPRMIEDHAMPFAASIQSVLRSELDIACRMGATYGNAYCGIVGGLERHEFSVLGPAVNLSARLMSNPENSGFLVDEGVRGETFGWQFHAREPVEAKGYSSLVPIFEPVMHQRSSWTRKNEGFVGREEQIESILEFSDDVVSSGCSSGKMILISGPSGFGKTMLLSESVHQIQQHCVGRKHSQLVLGQMCCEDDLFSPMSVLGPIFLDVITKTGATENGGTVPATGESDEAAVVQFQSACEQAGIKMEHINTIRSLVFDNVWPQQDANSNQDVGVNNRVSASEEDEIARAIVSILLQSTIALDLVLLGLDDVSFLDEMSWRVLQLWFENAYNLVIICSSKFVNGRDINVAPSFWEYLFSAGLLLNRFLHIDLPPMNEIEIQRLISQVKDEITCRDSRAYRGSCLIDVDFAHEVYLQSGGNPRLAVGMVDRFAYNFDEDTTEGTMDESVTRQNIRSLCDDAEPPDVNDHILHRMDAVSAVVRTHLNLCAILGESFHTQEVVAVMEKYRRVENSDKEEHAEFVLETLNEAVWHGILEPESSSAGVYTAKVAPKVHVKAGRFRFTHALWREKIMQLTLDSWQADMQKLIQECNTKTDGDP